MMMFNVVLVLGWAMLSGAKASQFTIPTCSCTDFVNDAGFGNCNGHSKFSKVSFRACFVKLPSNCPDLVDSDSNPGKKISAQACKDRKRRLSTLIDSTIVDKYKTDEIIIEWSMMKTANFIFYNFVSIEYRQPIQVDKPNPENPDLMQGDDPRVYDLQDNILGNV